MLSQLRLWFRAGEREPLLNDIENPKETNNKNEDQSAFRELPIDVMKGVISSP